MDHASIYNVKLGEISVPLHFRFPETKPYFEGFLTPSDDAVDSPVYLDDETWNRYHTTIDSTNGIIESYLLIGLLTRYLLPFRSCIFHSVAFRWHGLVWLLCAPSGTGKTTQLRHWLNLYGEEIDLVSGDKPVLAFSPEGTVTVYASPWNGKECLRGSGSGPLGGILYLQQDDHNEIRLAEKKRMIFPLFNEFLFFVENREEILAVGALEDTLLRRYPMWILQNVGNEASAVLTHDTLARWLAEKEQAGDAL